MLLILAVTPVYGQLLSDRTGLVNRFDVESGGHSFEIELVSNFDIERHQYIQQEKRLTIFVNSGLENNLGELIIPKEVLNGNFTFYVNDTPSEQMIQSNDKISFITLNFTGKGTNKIDIIATNTIDNDVLVLDIADTPSEGGGCLIATAAFGSELAPQIQQLREIRDTKLMQTTYGHIFLQHFNQLYYSFSPSIADYERENFVFKEIVRLFLTPLISSLLLLNHANTDVQFLIIGAGIIAMNVALYLVVPIFLLYKVKQKLTAKSCNDVASKVTIS